MSRIFAASVVLALASGCRPPDYADYRSLWGDWSASVPWGWQILTDQQDRDFTQTTFIGPFDADFFLGAPSLSVRWYRSGRPHYLRDKRAETYSGPADFIRQMVRDVYGAESFVTGVKNADGTHADGPSQITLKASGLRAVYFTVLSPTPAPPKLQWGISEGKDGRLAVLRKHSYAIVPLEGGFYVLCYPATAKGHERHDERFRALLGSFTPHAAGPGGPAVKRAARGS